MSNRSISEKLLVRLITSIPDFRKLLFSLLTPTDIATIMYEYDIELTSKERNKYLNLLREIHVSHNNIMLIGRGVTNLPVRVFRPEVYWATRCSHDLIDAVNVGPQLTGESAYHEATTMLSTKSAISNSNFEFVNPNLSVTTRPSSSSDHWEGYHHLYTEYVRLKFGHNDDGRTAFEYIKLYPNACEVGISKSVMYTDLKSRSLDCQSAISKLPFAKNLVCIDLSINTKLYKYTLDKGDYLCTKSTTETDLVIS
ncbi:hypothetical protein DM02DRAFT_660168 [Periconia macrospinosa]|uniref:Uncharacterized protein n=1 Tax=Periconia macrospinosa TaxID=97972 RepID=A0A2V1DBA9_9PLEO|nr:hypothetical protein DM02DRAFT_660168 [Periconia macrospinosa]